MKSDDMQFPPIPPLLNDAAIKALQDYARATMELNAKDKTGPSPAPERPWPQYRDEYWSIAGSGVIDHMVWVNDDYDKGAFAAGNVFKTEAEARRVIEQRLVLNELHKLASNHPVANREYYLVHNGRRWYARWVTAEIPGAPRFKDATSVEHAISQLGDRLNVLLAPKQETEWINWPPEQLKTAFTIPRNELVEVETYNGVVNQRNPQELLWAFPSTAQDTKPWMIKRYRVLK